MGLKHVFWLGVPYALIVLWFGIDGVAALIPVSDPVVATLGAWVPLGIWTWYLVVGSIWEWVYGKGSFRLE